MKRLIKTQAGLDAFKERSPLLTQRQRSMFLLCDGRRGVEAVLAETATVGTSDADVGHLVAQGFLAWAPEADAEEAPSPVAPLTPPAQSQAQGRALHVEHWSLF